MKIERNRAASWNGPLESILWDSKGQYHFLLLFLCVKGKIDSFPFQMFEMGVGAIVLVKDASASCQKNIMMEHVDVV